MYICMLGIFFYPRREYSNSVHLNPNLSLKFFIHSRWTISIASNLLSSCLSNFIYHSQLATSTTSLKASSHVSSAGALAVINTCLGHTRTYNRLFLTALAIAFVQLMVRMSTKLLFFKKKSNLSLIIILKRSHLHSSTKDQIQSF